VGNHLFVIFAVLDVSLAVNSWVKTQYATSGVEVPDLEIV